MAKPVRIGCSGWNYRDWRGAIYPEGLPARRWLERYAEVFDTVEVNATFYRLAVAATPSQTGSSRPRPGFVFAVKASRYLTHVKRLTRYGPRRGALLRLDRAARRSRPSSGPVLWQLPDELPARRRAPRGGARAPAARAATASSSATRAGSPSEVYALLRAVRRGARDRRPSRAPVPDATRSTAGWTYVRFHYGRRGRRGNYSERELRGVERRIATWRSPRRRSSRTSTTTGRTSRRATPGGWRSG